MPLQHLLPELLPLSYLPYHDVQSLRQTCREGRAVPYAPHLNVVGTAYRRWRRTCAWREWRQLRRGLLLTDCRCHHCAGGLDLPHLFELRVMDGDHMYAIYYSFCRGCWSELCRQWSGPFTQPAEWTCDETQCFVRGIAEQPLPHPALPGPSPSAIDTLHSTMP